MHTITIATRQSPLALWQANHVKDLLSTHYPDLVVQLLPMTTQGDIILDTPLAKIGGKGLFVKELERALLDRRADIAVHSLKDVPMVLPDGLVLGAILQRETPFDAWVSNHFASLDDLPKGAIVGTSSLRRACQILHARNDIQIQSLRGNLGTRLGKLDNGEFDGIVLAASGLIRLGLGARIRNLIAPDICLPAAAQGILGIECRDDSKILTMLDCLNHHKDRLVALCERAVNARLGGSCQVPIGAFAQFDGDSLQLRALVGSPDGTQLLHSECTSVVDDESSAIALGTNCADTLLAQGAGAILANLGTDQP